MKKSSLYAMVIMSAAVVLAGCTATPSTPTTDTDTAPNPEVNGTGEQNTDTDQPTQGASIDKTALASCLTDAGVIMYGTNWCSHCQNQKAMFGDAFEEVTFVDCDANRPQCVAAGVQGYPTWKDANGDAYPGVQELERLASIAGCEQTE